MNLLFFSPRMCWPATTGARLRDYYLARHLAARSRLTYVSLRHPGEPQPEEPPAEAGFARYLVLTRDKPYTPAKLVRGLLGPLPVTMLNYFSKRVAGELKAILTAGRFDAVQLESTHLAPYVDVVRSAARNAVVLADWHNIESELMRRYAETAGNPARRLFSARTAHLIARAEQRMLASCDAHAVASERERQTLAARVPEARLAVVPNGVDTGFFSDPEMARAAGPARDGGTPPRIVFVGSMDYHANIDGVLWFVSEVWPRLRAAHPDVSFTVVGRDPAPQIRALAGNGITITGTVEDVRPYYRDTLAMVVPLRVGSGTRLKILEAMAAGVPVVSTRLGAEGLEVADGEDILLADTAEQMVKAIGALKESPGECRKVAEAGRALAARLYDWSIAGARLYEVYCDLLGAEMRSGR